MAATHRIECQEQALSAGLHVNVPHGGQWYRFVDILSTVRVLFLPTRSPFRHSAPEGTRQHPCGVGVCFVAPFDTRDLALSCKVDVYPRTDHQFRSRASPIPRLECVGAVPGWKCNLELTLIMIAVTRYLLEHPQCEAVQGYRRTCG